jgi:hypothetical protein
MLIRSPKGPNNLRNVDVKFYGVSYLEAPTIIRGLEITDGPTEVETSRVLLRAGGNSLRENRVFVLKSGDQRFLIVAAQVRVEENDLDWSESPFASLDG